MVHIKQHTNHLFRQWSDLLQIFRQLWPMIKVLLSAIVSLGHRNLHLTTSTICKKERPTLSTLIL